MLLAGARHLAAGAVTTPQISVFMNLNAARGATEEVRLRLEKHDGSRVRQGYLPREETLARMKANPGLRDVIEALAANPFPDAFVVSVARRIAAGDGARGRRTAQIAGRRARAAGLGLGEGALTPCFELGRTSLLLLAFLLGGGLVAITFSVIRMQVLTQQAEIEVSRLLGATEAFIRRPFLYHGFLLGLGGGAVAWLLVDWGDVLVACADC
jgi:cell division transport system permease protein